MRGVALWHVAKDRDEQIAGRLVLSRLLVEYPVSTHVPACQYYLGLVHVGLGQPEVAKGLLAAAQRNPGLPAELKERAKKAYLDIVTGK